MITTYTNERETCIGYLVPEHDAPAAELTSESNYLCAGCSERLDREVRPYRYGPAAPKGATAPRCPRHGDTATHYYDCIYCFGD